MKRRHTTAEESLLRRWKRLDEAELARRYRGMGGPVAPRYISRKKHPFDCGRPGCGICHSGKRFGHEETRQERAARMKLREAMAG